MFHGWATLPNEKDITPLGFTADFVIVFRILFHFKLVHYEIFSISIENKSTFTHHFVLAIFFDITSLHDLRDHWCSWLVDEFSFFLFVIIFKGCVYPLAIINDYIYDDGLENVIVD